MEVIRITDRKKEYLPLLLLADEEEHMVDRYLDRGDMFVFTDKGEVVGECVVVADGNGCELKNLAVAPAFRRMGYGAKIVEFVCARYASSCHSLQLGTGEVPSTLAFYRACGFVPFDRIPDFFTRNYPQPIVEEGILLRDMVYLRRRLSAGG